MLEQCMTKFIKLDFSCCVCLCVCVFLFQAEDGIRDLVRSRGLGDVYKRQAQDHAVWRYVMRQNVRYLPHVAHSSYLDGLRKTGISIDYIPHMYGMNRILKEIGWAAVAVDGLSLIHI